MPDEFSRIVREERLPIKKVNTIIGVNAIFRGNFVVEGPLRVDGFYEGDIKSLDMIIVGSTARVKGDIYGEIVVVGGKVKGDIYAIREIILLSTSTVIGNLTSQKILIDEGARFKGRFSRVGEEKIREIFDTSVRPYIEEEKKKCNWQFP